MQYKPYQSFNSVSSRATWRTHTPISNIKLPNHPIINRLKGVISNFDWHKCRAMIDLRKKGGRIQTKVLKGGVIRYRDIAPRRLSIRKERLEVLNSLLPLMLKYTNFDPDLNYLFECNRSIEQLAKELGMLNLYPAAYDTNDINTTKYYHGRQSCDPVRGALDDLEASNLIIVVREFDKQTSKYKMSRLFIRPSLFEALGLSISELNSRLEQHKKHLRKQGRKPSFKQNMDRFATIKSKTLNNLLDFDKRIYRGLYQRNLGQLSNDALTASKKAVVLTPAPKCISNISLNFNNSISESELKDTEKKAKVLMSNSPRIYVLSALDEARAHQINSLPYYNAIIKRLS